MELNARSLSSVEEYLQDQSAHTCADVAAAKSSVKMEDHVATITPDLLSLATPPPEGASSTYKTTKKRKSWGQVLPEPKTSLPPRKRAKTADEKEQRRIERVKRNRLAAHNSRERKREEMDHLQSKNDDLVAQMHEMQKRMDAMAKELKAFRSGSTPSVPSFDFTTQRAQASVPSPPMTATASSVLQTPELGNLDSPRSELDGEFPDPATPPMDAAFGSDDVSPELTQQSAALLCDLQCRSPETSRSCRRSSSQPTPHTTSERPRSLSPQQYLSLATMALITVSLNIHLFLSTISTLSSTSTTSSPPLRALRTSSTSSSSAATPAARRPSTIYSTTALARPATSSTPSQQLTKAHLQKVATGLAALRPSRREPTHSSSSTRSSCEASAAVQSRGVGGTRRRQQQQRRGADVGGRIGRARLSRHGRRIVVSWNVKAACSGLGSGGRPESVKADADALGMALRKMRERGGVGRC